MDEFDLTGMTWYGALVAVILLMITWVTRRKRRFDTQGLTRSTIINLINETVFSERDRAVILRRLADGISWRHRPSDSLGLTMASPIARFNTCVPKRPHPRRCNGLVI